MNCAANGYIGSMLKCKTTTAKCVDICKQVMYNVWHRDWICVPSCQLLIVFKQKVKRHEFTMDWDPRSSRYWQRFFNEVQFDCQSDNCLKKLEK